nr:protein kinase [Microbacterium yannicii]
MAVAPDPWIAILEGQQFGDYKVGHHLGGGYFGLVFEAVNSRTGGVFAIKILRPGANADAVVDFENEGVLLRHLADCSGTINIVDGGSSDDVMINGASVPLAVQFHVLARASGSVNELILDPISRSKLSWIERIGFWRDVVLAVKQMHQRGIAHRDLKCDNCLLLVSRNLSSVKLTDLGRGKNFRITATRPIEHYVAGRGQLLHSPPEFLLHQGGSTADDFIAADYYGIGSILVELTTGQPMSVLAMGDIGAVLAEGRRDFAAGRRTDLSGYKPSYRSAVAQVVDQMPKTIQPDALTMLTHLCRPVPSERLDRPPFSRDRRAKDPLDWVLRRADIMSRRLEIDQREARQRADKQRRSA